MKVLSGLIQVLFIAVVILLFIDGEAGCLLLYTVIVAAIISAVPVVLSRNNIAVKMDDFSGITSVGEKTTARLSVSKKGFCFVPFVNVSGELGGQPFVAKLSLMRKNSSSVELSFRPMTCGLNRITVNEVRLSDLFGIVQFRRAAKESTLIGVLPRVVEYKGPNVTPSSAPTDDEQQEESRASLFGGMPGYEHREYVAGDSPRRINYKLSAKRQKLMVRLDESTAVETTNIMLSTDSDSLCAEQGYALAKKLVEQGAPVAIYFKGESFAAARPDSLDKLREWLAFRELDGAAGVEYRLPKSGTNVLVSRGGISVLA